MAALTHGGGEPRNGKATGETNHSGSVGGSPAHTNRNKVSAVRVHLRHSPMGKLDRQHAWLYTIKVTTSLITNNAPQIAADALDAALPFGARPGL
jgi:hypothetical protein